MISSFVFDSVLVVDEEDNDVSIKGGSTGIGVDIEDVWEVEVSIVVVDCVSTGAGPSFLTTFCRGMIDDDEVMEVGIT